MWILTPRGFVSAVEHRDNPDDIMVRARVRGDLVPLLEFAKGRQILLPHEGIVSTPEADYPFRITVSRSVFDGWVSEQVAGINYPNFKAACPAARHSAYMNVWADLCRLENIDPDSVRRVVEGEEDD